MPENQTSRTRDYAPVYECRGFSIPQFGTSIPSLWIWSRAADRMLGLRPSQLVQLSTLLAINSAEWISWAVMGVANSTAIQTARAPWGPDTDHLHPHFHITSKTLISVSRQAPPIGHA